MWDHIQTNTPKETNLSWFCTAHPKVCINYSIHVTLPNLSQEHVWKFAPILSLNIGKGIEAWTTRLRTLRTRHEMFKAIKMKAVIATKHGGVAGAREKLVRLARLK